MRGFKRVKREKKPSICPEKDAREKRKARRRENKEKNFLKGKERVQISHAILPNIDGRGLQ